jgi:phosphopantothenoylcysteine decarboxylase / phosphopantothenate---cysteine ligase
MTKTLKDKRILLIIGGGIAAYKSLELVRLLAKSGATVRAILTHAGAEFVTPLSLGSLTGDKVYTDLFDLTDEAEMGHIELSRDADLLVVAPATADLMAKIAQGLCNDLASTTLLATDKPVLIAPAMNVRMWGHAATRRNLAQLTVDGIHIVGPNEGDMACGEFGFGRMAEPSEIFEAIAGLLGSGGRPLKGRTALVTSGPTREAIDPVRYLANRSSGKQGHTIAAALARLGADVALVSGPVAIPDPAGVATIHVESAKDMLAACQGLLPVDIAVCVAAVADWGVADQAGQKIKKGKDGKTPSLALIENPDILATLSEKSGNRPALVIGFAAETERVVEHAQEKLSRKKCDWIVANDVSIPDDRTRTGVMGSDFNRVHIVSGDGVDSWPEMSKAEVAAKLAARIADRFSGPGNIS